KQYLGRVRAESELVPPALQGFEATLAELRGRLDPPSAVVAKTTKLDPEKKRALLDVATELREAVAPYEHDRAKVIASLRAFAQNHDKAMPDENADQHAARKLFDPNAEAIRGLIKQVDLLYKPAARTADQGGRLAPDP